MTRYRCLACLGEYNDTQPDGALYFHNCPDTRVDDAGGMVPIENPRRESPAVYYETGRTGPLLPGAGRVIIRAF